MQIAAVSAADPLSLAGTQPPVAIENENYSWTIAVKGGQPPYSCNITGTLPPGLSFDPGSLTISGKPNTGLSTDAFTFNINIADSSKPVQAADIPAVINVQYKAFISTTMSLSSGQATIFADGIRVTDLTGGQQVIVLFPSSSVHTISVNNPVTVAGDSNIRFNPVSALKSVTGNSPDVYFDFLPEYNIHIVTNDSSIPVPPGSGWYSTNALVTSSAPTQLETDNGIQYRFNHWQLPSDEVYGKPELTWKVTSGGDITAIYDTYYYLSVNSQYCDAQGSGWYKAGSKAKWSVECAQSIAAPGFWGVLGIEMKPEQGSGTQIMNAPSEIDITWKADYSRIIIPVVTGVTVAIILAVLKIVHDRARNVITKYKR